MIEISQLRFICKTHKRPLEICGNSNIFAPTCGVVDDTGWSCRRDESGWLSLDTSEMYCPECNDAFDQGFEEDQDWAIEAQ